jgi:hypothetical protein
MKKLLGAILMTLLLMASGARAKAQSLSQTDLDRGLQYLETTKKNIVDATRRLSEAQWNFKPSPFKWSVAQVMEHIAASEDLLRQMAEGQIKQQTPAVPDRELRKTDEQRRNGIGVIPPQLRPRVVLRYGDAKDLLVSGLLDGGGEIAQHAAVIDVPLGNGHVVVFSNNPIWRGETQGSYFLVFNAILNFDNLNAGQKLDAKCITFTPLRVIPFLARTAKRRRGAN